MKTIKSKIAGAYKFRVNAEFVSVGTKSLDTKNRISLGSRIAKFKAKAGKIDAYQMFENEDGDILLRPTVNIPAREAWIYQNPAALSQIRKGLAEAGEGKLKKTKDVDKFTEGL